MDSHSIQESLGLLYERADLGLVIADMEHVIDANDAALRMFGFTREEMREGKLSWQELTPPEFAHLDQKAVEQIKSLGACVPFEKEFILRDGKRLPFVIGAVRLTEEPLSWAAYALDLSESRRTAEIEQNARDLKAKSQLVNELAHELNNPLAGLTFILHLLKVRPDLGTEDAQKFLDNAAYLVERLSRSVQRVLAVTSPAEPV